MSEMSARRGPKGRGLHPLHKEQADAWVLTTPGPLDLTHGDMDPEFCLQEVAYLVVQVLMVFASPVPGASLPCGGLPDSLSVPMIGTSSCPP